MNSPPFQKAPTKEGIRHPNLVPGVDWHRDRELFIAPRSFEKYPATILHEFEPYDLSSPKRVGKMIRIPHFKPSESRKYIFNFPIVNYFGVFMPHVFAHVSMTHEKFILSLAETCFYRLKRCCEFRNVSRHTLYECALLYSLTQNDTLFSKFRRLARYQPGKLSKFVYWFVLNKLPERKQVYMSACVEALSRRSQNHLGDFGGKGHTYAKRIDDALLSKGRNAYRDYASRVCSKETLNIFGASLAPRCKRFKNPF